MNAAKRTVTRPDDEGALLEEAKRLAAELLPMAMTGHPWQQGEDIMRFSCHTVPQPSRDFLEHKEDAEKGGVRLWLLGSKFE